MGEERLTADETPSSRRLTVQQAAQALRITEGAVRGRIKRGTLRPYREAGKVYVLLEGVPEGVSSSSKRDPTSPQSDQSRLIDVLREHIAYLQGVIATRDQELDTRAEEIRRRDEEIRRRDAALEREQHLAAGFAERLRPLGASAEGGAAGGTHQDAPPAADAQLKKELEEALRGDGRLASLTPLYYAALPFVFGAGIVAGIANPLLIHTTNNALWSALYLLWVIPPIFGFWLGRRVAVLRENAWAVANGLETLLKATASTAAYENDATMQAFNDLLIRLGIQSAFYATASTTDNNSPPVDMTLVEIQNKLAAANTRLNVVENSFPVFSVGVGVVTLCSSLGTFWFVTDPSAISEAFRQMVGMAIVQGIFAAMFVLFAAFIVVGRARQKREEEHPPPGDRPRLLSGNSQALIGLIGTIVTAAFTLIGVLFEVFYGGGGSGG